MERKDAILWLAPISSFIMFIILTAAFGAMYYAGGYQFINSALGNSNLVNNYSFNFWTLAMGVSSNTALSLFIGIAWIFSNVAILGYGIIVVSRYLFAGAFDR